MKKISLFGADFEDSKKIVTYGKYSLTAGMSNPIHMNLLKRIFTVFIVGIFMFGILIYVNLLAAPQGIASDKDLHYISYESAVLISKIGSFLFPVNLLSYCTFLFALFPMFWPKNSLNRQVWTYFPFYFAMGWGGFVSVSYYASAVAFDAYTLLGFWLQVIVGIILFFWIVINSIQNLKRRLNDEEPKPILKKVLLMTLGMMILLFVVSLVYHQVNKLPILWYFYLFGLLLIVLFVSYAYLVAFLINAHIVQAYYIHKYPMEYKEYLEISDREWYSKRYYKKLVKSGQLEEE